MIKAYTFKLLENVPHIPLLAPNFGVPKKGNEIFRDRVFQYLTEPIIEVAEDPDQSDIILLPHNYFRAKKDLRYFASFVEISKKHKKPLVIFADGDRDEKVTIPNTIVLKYSLYKSSQKKNEIKMPTYTEDLASYRQIEFRKKGEQPTVGFCGWGDYSDLQSRIKSYLKYLTIDMRKILSMDFSLETHKKGIYFRKKILQKLSKSNLLNKNFIIRKSHSAHKKTIELSPERAREEYINNIYDSDLSLAIRGDANESMRFYEILSLGRVPILIDTDIVLPLEDEINYDEFVLRINYRNINGADQIISEFYKDLTEERFLNMQKKAREAFEKYLRIDAYLKFVFSNPEKLKIYAGSDY